MGREDDALGWRAAGAAPSAPPAPAPDDSVPLWVQRIYGPPPPAARPSPNRRPAPEPAAAWREPSPAPSSVWEVTPLHARAGAAPAPSPLSLPRTPGGFAFAPGYGGGAAAAPSPSAATFVHGTPRAGGTPYGMAGPGAGSAPPRSFRGGCEAGYGYGRGFDESPMGTPLMYDVGPAGGGAGAGFSPYGDGGDEEGGDACARDRGGGGGDEPGRDESSAPAPSDASAAVRLRAARDDPTRPSRALALRRRHRRQLRTCDRDAFGVPLPRTARPFSLFAPPTRIAEACAGLGVYFASLQARPRGRLFDHSSYPRAACLCIHGPDFNCSSTLPPARSARRRSLA
jgi:hypothetical protein